MKRLVVLVGIAAGLLALAGCSTGGSPFPAATTTAGQSTGGDQGSTSASSSNGTSLEGKNPCSLLTSSEASGLGLPSSGQSSQIGTAPACEWQASDFGVTIGIRTNEGLDQYSGDGQGTVTSITVNNRAAKQEAYTDGSGSCYIVLAVSATSRVDISTTANGGGASCTQARQVAQAVEPKLPPAS